MATSTSRARSASCSVADLRKRLADRYPHQWWRASGYGLQANGKFKCPCCGGEIDVLPYRKGIGRVRSHRIGGRLSRCQFANHMEPLNAEAVPQGE